jgi:Tfp pilus assembly protein PilN
MAQQINLHSPILLAPRRYFSALAMAQALLALAVGLAGLCAWTLHSTQTLRRDLQSASAAHGAERQRLTAALAQRPAPASDSAVLQEVAAEEKLLARRQQQRDGLVAGLASAGHSHSAWLQLLAQTVPAAVWLTEVKLGDKGVQISGQTREPEALRPWLASLSGHPLAAGHAFAALQVERGAAVPAGAELWSFQVAGGAAAQVQR